MMNRLLFSFLVPIAALLLATKSEAPIVDEACGRDTVYDFVSDSLTVVNADWQIDSLVGFVLKRHRFDAPKLFGANQFVAFVEVPSSSPLRLAFCYEPRRTVVSEQARRHQAAVAVNGSFFDMTNHNPICYLRIDGKECGENTPGVDTLNRKYYQYGSMSIRQGRPYIFSTDSNRHWEESLSDSNIMTAGPLLLLQGERTPQRDDRTFVTQRHNRTAIGVKEDGTMILLVADGRTSHSAGFSLTEFASLLKWLGCVDALNLDGGGSSTLYVSPQCLKGKDISPIVNYPTDNGRYDHAGERAVSSCVLLL